MHFFGRTQNFQFINFDEMPEISFLIANITKKFYPDFLIVIF